MNYSSDNPQPLSEIIPPVAPSENQKTTTGRSWMLPLRNTVHTIWLKLRHGSKPSLKTPSLRPLLKVFKKYWWAAIIVLALAAAAGTWFTIDHNNKQAWLQAADHYRRADYAKAAPLLLNQPLPEEADKLRMYGQTMQATNNPDKALAAYQKLYELDKDPFAKLVMGNIHNQKQQYPEAIKAYQELLDANPTYVQAYVNLATVYRLQGKNSQAIEVAEQALQNNPNNVILAELAVSLTADNPSSNQHRQAIARLKKLNPEDPLLKELNLD